MVAPGEAEPTTEDHTESPTSPTVRQVKVVVHQVEQDEDVMLDEEYAQAVENLINVDNLEVRKKAKIIASKKRTMERAVERMWAFIKGADKSMCPQVAIRMKEITAAMESVDCTAEAFGDLIKETCATVAEHITDRNELTGHKNRLIMMLKQAALHTRK